MSESAKKEQIKSIALYDFDGQTEGELTFKAGDIIVVLNKDEDEELDGWWEARLEATGKVGFVPKDWVKELTPHQVEKLRAVNVQKQLQGKESDSNNNCNDDEDEQQVEAAQEQAPDHRDAKKVKKERRKSFDLEGRKKRTKLPFISTKNTKKFQSARPFGSASSISSSSTASTVSWPVLKEGGEKCESPEFKRLRDLATKEGLIVPNPLFNESAGSEARRSTATTQRKQASAPGSPLASQICQSPHSPCGKQGDECQEERDQKDEEEPQEVHGSSPSRKNQEHTSLPAETQVSGSSGEDGIHSAPGSPKSHTEAPAGETPESDTSVSQESQVTPPEPKPKDDGNATYTEVTNTPKKQDPGNQETTSQDVLFREKKKKEEEVIVKEEEEEEEEEELTLSISSPTIVSSPRLFTSRSSDALKRTTRVSSPKASISTKGNSVKKSSKSSRSLREKAIQKDKDATRHKDQQQKHKDKKNRKRSKRHKKNNNTNHKGKQHKKKSKKEKKKKSRSKTPRKSTGSETTLNRDPSTQSLIVQGSSSTESPRKKKAKRANSIKRRISIRKIKKDTIAKQDNRGNPEAPDTPQEGTEEAMMVLEVGPPTEHQISEEDPKDHSDQEQERQADTMEAHKGGGEQ